MIQPVDPEPKMLISVRLYVRGDKLDPEQISNVLGITTKNFHRKDDKYTSVDGKTYGRPTGVWVWGITQRGDAISVHTCIQEFLVKLSHSAHLVSSLPNAEEIWVDVLVIDGRKRCDMNDFSSEFYLEAEQLSGLNALKVPVAFTVDLDRDTEQ